MCLFVACRPLLCCCCSSASPNRLRFDVVVGEITHDTFTACALLQPRTAATTHPLPPPTSRRPRRPPRAPPRARQQRAAACGHEAAGAVRERAHISHGTPTRDECRQARKDPQTRPAHENATEFEGLPAFGTCPTRALRSWCRNQRRKLTSRLKSACPGAGQIIWLPSSCQDVAPGRLNVRSSGVSRNPFGSVHAHQQIPSVDVADRLEWR